MPLTAAERRAKIRERLREAQEPAGTVEETTNTFTEEPKQEPTESVTESSAPSNRSRPSTNRLQRFATARRQSKPTNYKLHVLTALSLAVVIRVAHYGSKALTG